MGKIESHYRPGFGVTLLRGISEENLYKSRYPYGAEPGYSQDTIKWPLGNILPGKNTGIDTLNLIV